MGDPSSQTTRIPAETWIRNPSGIDAALIAASGTPKVYLESQPHWVPVPKATEMTESDSSSRLSRSLQEIDKDIVHHMALVKALQTTGLVVDAPRFYRWAAAKLSESRNQGRYRG